MVKPLVVKNGRKVLVLSVVLLAGMMAAANAELTAVWRYSSANTKWVNEAALAIVPKATVADYVDLDTTVKYQTIDGWGGSPNEIGTNALHKLPAALQDSVIKLLFDTVTGCKFNVIRLPIGCTDFSLGGYTLNDTPNDTLMTNINITRDSLGTIKFTKDAMRYNPNLQVWGSPWTAPKWMKNNNNWWGGGANTEECALIQTPKILTAYALYFSKAIQLYKDAGLPYFALAFQNEPRVCQPFPSMRWSSGTTMANFMKYYLYPRMHADHPDIQLWTPTMNVADHTYFAPLLNDTATTHLVATGVQYEGKDAVVWLHATYPNIKIYATELVCGGGDNQWAYAFDPTFRDIKFYFDNGASGAFQWNLMLDKSGSSGPMINWIQNSMITMDTVAKTIMCQPQYYVLKHMSYYIRPGARIIRITGSYMANVIAAQNPDGSVAVVAQNNAVAAQQIAVRFFGSQMVRATLPGSSFASFLISTNAGVIYSPKISNLAAVNRSFKVIGEKFMLPKAYVGKTCKCSVFDIKGKFIREVSTKNRIISLSRDFGIPEGVYVVRIRALP
jgi:glucosylceramidase